MNSFGPEIITNEKTLQQHMFARSAAISTVIGEIGSKNMAFYQKFQELARDKDIKGSTKVMDANLLKEKGLNISPEALTGFVEKAKAINNLALGGPEAMAKQLAGLLQEKDPGKIPENLRPYVAQAKLQLRKAEEGRAAIADPSKFSGADLEKVMHKMATSGQFDATARLAEQVAREHVVSGTKASYNIFEVWQAYSAAIAQKAGGIPRPEEPFLKGGIIQPGAHRVAEGHVKGLKSRDLGMAAGFNNNNFRDADLNSLIIDTSKFPDLPTSFDKVPIEKVGPVSGLSKTIQKALEGQPGILPHHTSRAYGALEQRDQAPMVLARNNEGVSGSEVKRLGQDEANPVKTPEREAPARQSPARSPASLSMS